MIKKIFYGNIIKIVGWLRKYENLVPFHMYVNFYTSFTIVKKFCKPIDVFQIFHDIYVNFYFFFQQKNIKFEFSLLDNNSTKIMEFHVEDLFLPICNNDPC